MYSSDYKYTRSVLVKSSCFWIIIFYLIFCFIGWSFNPAYWFWLLRLLYVVICALLIYVAFDVKSKEQRPLKQKRRLTLDDLQNSINEALKIN